MSDSIIKSIFTQILADLAALVTDNTVRKVELRNSTMLSEPLRPALHVVPGDEQLIDEDSRGYTFRRDVRIKVMFDAWKGADAFNRAVELVARVREKIEADLQLTPSGGSALCSHILYQGEVPYITDATTPEEGTIVLYTVEYRTPRATPTSNY